MKILIVNPEKCVDCKICELVCSFKRGAEYQPSKSFIKVLRNEEINVFIPVLQMGCNPDGCEKCVKWCPTQALKFVSPRDAALIRKNNKIELQYLKTVTIK